MRIDTRMMIAWALCLSACGASASPMRLRRVVLYQNGVGYFERSGRSDAEGLRLRLARHEVDDVLTTLTVLDPERPEGAESPSAVVPRELASEGETQTLEVGLGGRARDVTVAYSAPTSAWRASYRVVLPEERGASDAFLQAWAVVDNTTAEDWTDVDLTLATDAPLSFAVDLRTPRTVDRPNVTGHHVPAIAFGPVRSEQTTRTRDGDGIPDAEDACPDEPEDMDGFEDEDGCPEPDNDADGILDVDDACPLEPEGYNGASDDDGCPDAGRVVVDEARLAILDQIFFADGDSEIGARSHPILDAIAATLQGNPQIARLDVEGHADPAEDEPWRLSAERAATVRAALLERGISAARLTPRPLGDSQPASSNADDPRNRRVGFSIAERAGDAPRAERPRGVRRASLRRSAHQGRLPEVGGTGTRFPVARGVTIEAGSSAMVTILHRPVEGEDVLLFRVDPNVPASARHPFRAARLVNVSGVDLVPGPVSLFAGGELVGEGLLDALRAGQNAYVPYAVDTSTRISPSIEERTEPARILSFAAGELEVERTRIRRTTYAVEAGARVPGRVFVRHRVAAGFAPHDLPPGTETRGDALLVPLPLSPSRDARLTVEARAPATLRIDLLRDLRSDLGPYVEGTDLEGPARTRFEELLDARDALRRVGDEARLLRQQLSENAARAEELRRTVATLDERAGRSAGPARRRVADRLEEASRRGEQLASQLATARARQVEARLRLRDAANEFRFPAPAP